MTIYTGETIEIKAKATTPAGSAITDATVTVEFYAPPKTPATDPTDRAVIDKGPFAVTWVPARSAYIATVPTATWLPGAWWYRVHVAGTYTSWEYATVTLVE